MDILGMYPPSSDPPRCPSPCWDAWCFLLDASYRDVLHSPRSNHPSTLKTTCQRMPQTLRQETLKKAAKLEVYGNR